MPEVLDEAYRQPHISLVGDKNQYVKFRGYPKREDNEKDGNKLPCIQEK